MDSASTEQIRISVADFVDRVAQKFDVYSIPMYLPLKQVTEEFTKILNLCSNKIEVNS